MDDASFIEEEEDDPAFELDDTCPNPVCGTQAMWVTKQISATPEIRCGACGEPYPAS